MGFAPSSDVRTSTVPIAGVPAQYRSFARSSIADGVTADGMYPPLATKPGPGEKVAGSVPAEGGTTARVGLGGDRREVGRRTHEPHGEHPAVSLQADGVGRPAAALVVGGALHLVEQRCERRRRRGVEHPHPAAADVLRGERAPVGEGQAVAQGEHGGPSAVRVRP